MARFEIDLDIEDGVINCGIAHMDDDAARTIYFALCNERDKVVADIARYHQMEEALLDQLCDEHVHQQFDPFCLRCRQYKEAHDEYLYRWKGRDEDLMFLGEYLNKITTILFEMGANNTPEFDKWLSV